MDVTRMVLIAAVAIYFATSVPPCCGQAPANSRYDPAVGEPSSKPRGSFLDFTLKRINPEGKDYGQCISEGRRLLVEETLNNGYFWSNLVALGLLGCLFAVNVRQRQVQINRDRAASEIIAQYEQALRRSKSKIDESIQKNRNLAESLAALNASAARHDSITTTNVDQAASKPARTTAAVIHAASPGFKRGDGKLTVERPSAAPRVNQADQIALFKPDVELVTKVNTLEQQLGRSHEVEKQLRRQLNETARRLQAEQERNGGGTKVAAPDLNP